MPCLIVGLSNLPICPFNQLPESTFEQPLEMKTEEETKSEEGFLEFKIQKKRPKKNAKSYHIENVQDIFNAVTSKNIKKFLREFEILLRSGLLIKAIHEANIKEGKYTEEESGKIEFKDFNWIDDWSYET